MGESGRRKKKIVGERRRGEGGRKNQLIERREGKEVIIGGERKEKRGGRKNQLIEGRERGNNRGRVKGDEGQKKTNPVH